MTRKPTGRPRGRPAGSPNKKPKKADAKTSVAPKRATRSTTPEQATAHPDTYTPDQRFAKLLEHSRKLSAAEAAVVAATTARKGARDLARAELGKAALHQIRFFEQLGTEEGQQKWKDQIEWQIECARWQQMPVGFTEDLFKEDREPIEDKAFADGKRAGLNGDGPTPPDRYGSGVRQQKWMAGYHEGQGVLMKGFKAPTEPAADTETANASDNYIAMGATAFRAGVNDICPADVPVDQTENWRMGYHNAKAAHEHTQAKAAGARFQQPGVH